MKQFKHSNRPGFLLYQLNNSIRKCFLGLALFFIFLLNLKAQCPGNLTFTPSGFICNAAQQTYNFNFNLRSPVSVSPNQWNGYLVTSSVGTVSLLCQGAVPTPPCIWPFIYTPVCGCDGNTYSNGDHAACYGITSSTSGTCTGNIPVAFVVTGIPQGQTANIYVTVFIYDVSSGNVVTCEYTFQSLAPPTPGVPTSITGQTSICTQAEATYQCPSVANATGYTWTVPSGAQILNGQGTRTVTVRWGNSGGDICVKSQNGCGMSAPRCVSVDVRPPVNIQNITTSGLVGTFQASGGLPQNNGSTYASVTMSLQGNPGVTATLNTPPFTHKRR